MSQPTTTTATLLTTEGPVYVHHVCIDDEGTLFLAISGGPWGGVDVHVGQRRRGSYAFAKTPVPLPAGPERGTLSSACMNPLDRRQLVVATSPVLWTMDTVTGAARRLGPPLVDYARREPFSSASCGGPWVWFLDSELGQRLLRLDMRSLDVARVVPTLQQGQVEISALLCVDPSGNAICHNWRRPQLWRVQPDGAATLLAGTGQAGYRDGPAAEAQFGTSLSAAAAGDGSIVVADHDNRRVRLVAPDGTVTTLAGSGKEGAEDGPLALASFDQMVGVAVSADGDVLVIEERDTAPESSDRVCDVVVRTVPARLPPPPHLAAQPAAPHPAAALNGGLLQSGLLADAAIRVVAAASAASEDIPCHRAILSAASPFFKAMFTGPLAQEQQGTGALAGRKRKVDDGAALTADAEQLPVVTVTVDDASADAVRAVLRHVYTGGDLGGVTAATAQAVLHLAQQWGVDGLLEAGQAYVAERLLGPANAAEWLVCAHLRQYNSLRRAALRAVVQHYNAVRADEAQMALLTAHPMLLVEAMDAMAARGVGAC